MIKQKRYYLQHKNYLYLTKDEKFKSIGICLVYNMAFKAKYITAFLVLTKVLRNCSKKYPSIKLTNERLDELYGLNLGIDFSFSGTLMQIKIKAETINPKYTDNDQLLEEVLLFIEQMVYSPLISENHFDKNIVDICKEVTYSNIVSENDDNVAYVLNELREGLGKPTDAITQARNGTLKDLKKVDEYSLLEVYNLLINAPFNIYLLGDIKLNPTAIIVKKYFSNKNTIKKKYSPFKLMSVDPVPEKVITKKNINQSKLAIVYSLPILFDDERNYACRVFNGILGGSMYSKLQQNVREKLGLCYSISSFYNSSYGMLTILTGVNQNNIEKTIRTINEQIKSIQNGNISDEEMSKTKQSFVRDLLMHKDSIFSQFGLIIRYQSFNENIDLDNLIERYNRVNKKDIIEVAKLVKYKTNVILKTRGN